jgi:hypothetical protein
MRPAHLSRAQAIQLFAYRSLQIAVGLTILSTCAPRPIPITFEHSRMAKEIPAYLRAEIGNDATNPTQKAYRHSRDHSALPQGAHER